MSEHEFENYLRLLGGLLKLSSKQREAIAGELRAHLDERLHDLTEQGIPRDEAVAIALEEFGDAAGLAADFTRIGRQRQRRWIMRVTFGSITAAAAAAMVAMALWPDPQGRVTVQSASAEQKGEPATVVEAKAEPDVAAASGDEQRNARTAEKLARLAAPSFAETPLDACLQDLGELCGVQFFIDRANLEDEGIGSDVPITIELAEVPVDMLLDLILGQLNLGYTIRSGIVIVTTRVCLEQMLETRVYDVRDLLASTAAGVPPDRGATTPAAEDPTKTSTGGVAGGTKEDSGEGVLVPSRTRTPVDTVTELNTLAHELLNRLSGYGPGGTFGVDQRMLETSRRLAELSRRISSRWQGGVQLIEIITSAVEPDSWNSAGGPGSIGEYRGALIVSQTSVNHRQIQRLLENLRAAAKRDCDRPADRPDGAERTSAPNDPFGTDAAIEPAGSGGA